MKQINQDLIEKIKSLVDDYIDGANDAEDQPMKPIEISRLKDFVIYCENLD